MKAPDVQPTPPPEPVVPRPPANARPPRRPRPDRIATLLAVVAGALALAALAASGWIYADTRQEVLRLSTELAQTRLNLELRTRSSSPVPATAAASGDASGLEALSTRLGVLEQAWRQGGMPAGTPALPAAPGTPGAAQPGEDCLPSGMRILVTTGDSYPVCNTTASVDVLSVSDGIVVLGDGATIPSGGTLPLGTSGCMVAVTSGGDEGATGYAEIRVSC